MEGPISRKTHYEIIGGEIGVRRLVERFYDLMDASPEASHVRALHATSLKSSRERLYWFLSGWLGGPQLFLEHRGNPMLRARHLPFAIGETEAREWLCCMERALGETPMPDELRTFLWERLTALAHHMQNK